MEQDQALKIELMAYMDGELAPGEREQFERTLMQSTELQQELAEMQQLKSIIGRVRIPEPKPELWDERPRPGLERWFRLVGWILFILGGLFLLGIGNVNLWQLNELHWSLKFAITLMEAGLVVLLVSVFFRRRKEFKTDRYKEIIR